MSVQRNFVVKNGIEVNGSLIYADKTINKVGVGTTSLTEKLQVGGGIGADNLNISGVGTIPTLYTTNANISNLTISSANIPSITGTNLYYTGISTFSSGPLVVGSASSTGIDSQKLQVTGDVYISGNLGIGTTSITNRLTVNGGIGATTLNISGVGTITNFNTTNLSGTIGTITNFNSTNATITNIYSTGITTVGNLIVSGIITSSSGVVTYYGDGSQLTGIVAGSGSGVGIRTSGGTVGSGATILDFRGSGISTVTVSGGIGTIYIEAGITTSASIATYATNAGVATYATNAGVATYATNAGVATYATNAGIVTDLKGGSAGNLLYQLSTDNTDFVTNATTSGQVLLWDGLYPYWADIHSASFVNGPFLIGSASSTGTSGQIFQITGGAYVSGNLGIGSTNPSSKLSVVGDVLVSGAGTFGSLSISGTQVVSSARQLQNIASLDATTTATIESAIQNAPNTFNDLNVTGVSTLGVTSATNLTSQLLNVSGVSTFAGITTVTGTTLFSKQLNVSGVSTFAGITTVTGDTLFSKQLNVSGVTTSGGINVTTGNDYKINSTSVLTSTTLGSGVTNSSLTSVGTLGQLNVSGVSTLGVTTATNLTLQQLNVSGLSTSGGINVTTGNDYKINSTSVLTSTTLGSGVVNSSLTSVGTLGQLNVSGVSTFAGITTITSTTLFTSQLVVSGIITCTDLNSTSDINLKENIQTVEDALDIVNNLRGVKFEWKENHKPSFGIIAQELQEILPELVTDTDPKTVNYNGIIGVLIEAVKELSAEVEILKKKVL